MLYKEEYLRNREIMGLRERLHNIVRVEAWYVWLRNLVILWYWRFYKFDIIIY